MSDHIAFLLIGLQNAQLILHIYNRNKLLTHTIFHFEEQYDLHTSND